MRLVETHSRIGPLRRHNCWAANPGMSSPYLSHYIDSATQAPNPTFAIIYSVTYFIQVRLELPSKAEHSMLL